MFGMQSILNIVTIYHYLLMILSKDDSHLSKMANVHFEFYPPKGYFSFSYPQNVHSTGSGINLSTMGCIHPILKKFAVFTHFSPPPCLPLSFCGTFCLTNYFAKLTLRPENGETRQISWRHFLKLRKKNILVK